MAVAGTPAAAAAAAETEETERKRTATGAGTGGATGYTTGGWGRTTGLSPTRRPSPPGVPAPLLLPQVWKLLLWLQKYDIWFLGVRCGAVLRGLLAGRKFYRMRTVPGIYVRCLCKCRPMLTR